MKACAFVALALSLGLTVACVGNHASVEFARVCVHPEPSSEGSCEYPATCDLGDLLNQRVDVGPGRSSVLSGAYLWTPIQVNNQLLNNADVSIGRANTNDAFIEEYQLRFQATGISLPGVTFKVGPQLIGAQGSAVLLVPILPKVTGDALSAIAAPLQVVVTMKAAGRLGDDSSFVTGEYKVPVEVCNGCMYSYTDAAAFCAPSQLACCPQYGQSASCKCL